MPSQPTIKAMQTAVANDPTLADEFQRDPQKAVEKLMEAADKYSPITDPFIYRAVVLVLSGVLIITVLALVVTLFVSAQDNAPVELIVGLGSTALGALAGLLAPSPVRTGG